MGSRGPSKCGEDVELGESPRRSRRRRCAWPTELRILRDEPDQLLLYFLRAPSKNPQA
jgi:hypothetical protein